MKYLKIYTDFLDVTAQLSDGAMGRLFRAMLRYAQDGTEPLFRGKEGVAWAVARQHIDREKEAYEAMVEARREAGRRSGQVRKQRGTNVNETNQDKDKEKENDKDKDKDKEREYAAADAARALPAPPSLEEIEAYCRERGNRVNAQRFLDFYTANGWKVGKNSMKDWKAAVRSWETNGMDERTGPVPAKEPSVGDSFRIAMEMMKRKEAKEI